MADSDQHLRKTLGLKEVFAISTGSMISSGLFVLPAVVFLKAGPSILVAYLLASLFIIPSMLSKAELATAMPKAGGIYFFITRSFGPLFGTFTGLASWFSLSLKSSFALVGIGVFLEPLVPHYSPNMVKMIAVGFTLLFTVLNLLSSKESGRVQFILVVFLLIVLAGFIFFGVSRVELSRFQDFAPKGWKVLPLVTGMIFISYGGLTKVASMAEEIKDPKKMIPLGMFSAYGVVSLIYLLAIFVTIGVIPDEVMRGSLTPLSTAAESYAGSAGFLILAVAAMLAFVTTANAGLMAASRSPLAMSRDNLLPPLLGRVGRRFHTPVFAILLTSAFMITCIVFLDIEHLVKVASTMKLLMFTMVNISVIFMRQSKIVSYRPSFRAPFYPVLQIIGILVYVFLILQMGRLSLILSGAFFLISVIWYFVYVKSRASQKSAFIRMMEGLTNKDIVEDEASLEGELIDLLRERDQIKEDRFDSIIANALVMDMDMSVSRAEFFHLVAEEVSDRWKIETAKVEEKLQIREAQASTLIYPGVAIPHAIPHIIIEGTHTFDIVLVRNKNGIVWNEAGDIVYTAFCLLGTKDERNFHLKALMSIAQILQDPEFHELWMHARSPEELRTVILVTKRRRG
ncbi:MAG: amino acid permease [Spirochaetales bacterium]|nr:amino acid permease [Spirochaetales bacterium]